MECPPCDDCGRGTLVPRKQHRLAVGWVVLGYCLLVLSALALLYAILMLAFAGAITQAGLPAEAKAEMDRAKVPEDIQAKVANRESIPDSDLKNFTPEQKRAVRDGQSRMGAQTLGFGFMAVLIGLSAAILGVLALPGLLIGWLLVRRKRVLACDRCGAVAV